MDLGQFVDNLRHEFAVAAEAGGAEERALAERLFTQLEAATRLTLLEALSAATDEITRELAPGSVHVRLRGREPSFVVSLAVPPTEPADDPRPTPPPPAHPAAPPPTPDGDEGGTSRINLRIPDHLKASVEAAAGRAGLSINAWLVRAVATAVESGDADPRPTRRPESKPGQHVTGWVR
jgi:HicB family